MPEGDVEQLKTALKEAGLTFETKGIVPFKASIDFSEEKEYIRIRELQIRINGRAENNCWSRKKQSKEKRFISKETLILIIEQLEHIPVKRLHIEAESNDQEQMDFILSKCPYKEVLLFVQEGLSKQEQEYLKKICRNRNATVTFLTNGKKNMKDLKIEIYDFFYNQHFNPCLGQQVAVDCGGEIKPCLWWDTSLGTIGENNLIDMINTEALDEYWKLTKDKINVCKNCELRYFCPDCRMSHSTSIGTDFLKEKPAYCTYDPYSGDYANAPIKDFKN